MGWISYLLLIILGMGVFLFSRWVFNECRYTTNLGGSIAVTILSAIAGGMVAFVIFMMVLLLTMLSSEGGGEYEVLEQERIEIEQISFNDTSVYVMQNIIEGRNAYQYYYKTENDMHTLDYLYEDKGSKIIETDADTPNVMLFTKIRYTDKPNWWQRGIFGYRHWTEYESVEMPSHFGYIYIPKNTI